MSYRFLPGKDNPMYGKNLSGPLNGFFGKKHSIENRLKLKEIALLRVNPMLGRKHTEETKEKIRQKALLSTKRGVESNFWKGGNYPEHLRIKRSSQYKQWRMKVFVRDKFSCVECGARSGEGKHVTLNADHIKPFSLFPELRFDISNGRTLCVECHKKTDTFGGRMNKYEIKKQLP